MEEKKKYDIVEDDVFEPGNHVKLEHTLFLNDYDISDLLQKSPEEVRELYYQCVNKEENMYEILQAGMRGWANDAQETRRVELALNQLEIAPVEHGEFQPDAQKPSVLDKISEAKTQQKAVPAAPCKKKNEQAL